MKPNMFLKLFDMLAIDWYKDNKTFAMFTVLAYKWKTPSSIHLLGIEFPAKTTR